MKVNSGVLSFLTITTTRNRFPTMIRVALVACLSLLLCGIVDGRNGEHHEYNLRQRSYVQTTEFTFDQLDALRPFSFSEDSDPILLEPFSITVFETDGILPQSPSLNTIEDGFEEFLLKELNDHFNVNHQVKSVHSRALSQTPAASSTGGVNVMSGTQLRMAVDIIFEYDPTPGSSSVESAFDDILRRSDLSTLVSNITSRSTDDVFLKETHTVVYDGKLPDYVEPDDDAGVVGIVTTVPPEKKATFFSSTFLVPVFIAFVLLLLGVLLFIVPRRTKEDTTLDEPPPIRVPNAGVSILDSDDGNIDVYIEGSLSPDDMDGYSSVEHDTNSPRSFLSQKSTLSSGWNKRPPPDDQSDVFSGIGGVSSKRSDRDLSPRNDSRSIYSFLTGLTSRGSKASTVIVSNVTEPVPPKLAPAYQPVTSPASPTPRSRMSSLFTFSEEEEETDTDDGSLTKSEKIAIHTAPSDEGNGKAYSIDESNSLEESTAIEHRAPTTQPLSPGAMSFSALAAGAIALVQGSAASAATSEKGVNVEQSSSADYRMDTASKSKQKAQDLADSTGTPSPTTQDLSVFTTEEIANELKFAEEKRKQCAATNELFINDQTLKQSALACGILGAKPNVYVRDETVTSPQLIDATSDRSTPDMGQSSHETGPRQRAGGETPPQQTVRGGFSDGSTNPIRSYSPVRGTKPDPGESGTSKCSPSTTKNFVKRFFKAPKPSTLATSAFLGGAGAKAALASRDELADNDAEDPRSRQPTGSAGFADGTSKYQNDNADHGSTVSSYKGSLSFRRGQGKPLTVNDKVEFEAKLPEENVEEWLSPSGRVRRHTKAIQADGTNNYQNEFMHDYSVADLGEEEPSLLDSTYKDNSKKRRLKIASTSGKQSRDQEVPSSPSSQTSPNQAATPKSHASLISALSGGSPPVSAGSPESASKKLISDLLWLEKKITPGHHRSMSRSPTERRIQHGDSLSFESGDGAVSTDSGSSLDQNEEAIGHAVASGIICRDCVAPPGKLKIVICSTKDGPAIHTVKKGSSLEGQVFSGDLIISVDNVDTRSYSAEQVMRLMTAKTNETRRITVLHFGDGDDDDNKNSGVL